MARRLNVAYSTFRKYKAMFPALSAPLARTREYVDLVEIVGELRAEVDRLRTCGTCGHRRVCHLLWLHGNDDFEISKPCGHWVEDCVKAEQGDDDGETD